MLRILTSVGLLAIGGPALATEALPITEKSACMSGPVAQFGRYVGEWDIDDQQLQQDGVTWLPGTADRWDFYCVGDGLAVQDFWRPEGGSLGTNLRTWNPEKERWEIVWTATQTPGVTIISAVQQDDGRIVMHYESPIPTPRRRITFFPPDQSGWRWVMELSNDEGSTWFEVYRIKATPAAD